MIWNWTQPDWPHFTWEQERLAQAEAIFLHDAGLLAGTLKHLAEPDAMTVTVDSLSTEALTTSEIEGEAFDRKSIQSSILRQLGLPAPSGRARAGEEGIAAMVVDLRRTWARPLSDRTLFRWHRMAMNGRTDLRDVGAYRTIVSPMQVVSQRGYTNTIHFEAPPSRVVPREMAAFVAWFNRTASAATERLPALTRAGISHLYFESIHPFEDGNGRIGRAIAEMALAQSLNRPTLIALAATILLRRREYYNALEAANKSNEITPWLAWFAGMCVEAQRRTIAEAEFHIDKSRLLNRLRGQLNPRQEKALHRMLREGPSGFVGGLSASKYTAITRTSAATATRDLADLAAKGALERRGERRHTRYELGIPLRPVPLITVDERGNIVERIRRDPPRAAGSTSAIDRP